MVYNIYNNNIYKIMLCYINKSTSTDAQTIESAQTRESSLLAHTRVFLVELPCTHACTHAHTRTHIMDVDEDSASSPAGRFKSFYIYVISRRLAGLLINFKESDWSRVPKF